MQLFERGGLQQGTMRGLSMMIAMKVIDECTYHCNTFYTVLPELTWAANPLSVLQVHRQAVVHSEIMSYREVL